jgi:hypothetical protein
MLKVRRSWALTASATESMDKVAGCAGGGVQKLMGQVTFVIVFAL